MSQYLFAAPHITMQTTHAEFGKAWFALRPGLGADAGIQPAFALAGFGASCKSGMRSQAGASNACNFSIRSHS